MGAALAKHRQVESEKLSEDDFDFGSDAELEESPEEFQQKIGQYLARYESIKLQDESKPQSEAIEKAIKRMTHDCKFARNHLTRDALAVGKNSWLTFFGVRYAPNGA